VYNLPALVAYLVELVGQLGVRGKIATVLPLLLLRLRRDTAQQRHSEIRGEDNGDNHQPDPRPAFLLLGRGLHRVVLWHHLLVHLYYLSAFRLLILASPRDTQLGQATLCGARDRAVSNQINPCVASPHTTNPYHTPPRLGTPYHFQLLASRSIGQRVRELGCTCGPGTLRTTHRSGTQRTLEGSHKTGTR